MNVLFRSPMGALLARPWVDGVALAGLRRYLPLSRLWAAANEAGDDIAHFPGRGGWPEPFVRSLLRRNARAREASEAARKAWEEGIFGGGGEGRALDWQRRLAATRHLSTRGLFYPLLFPKRPPTARWQIVPPAEAERDLGAILAEPGRLYAAPSATGTFEQSVAFEHDGVRQYWLRAETPAPRLRGRAGSERLYARVVEPAGAAARHTLIFGSGLCLETELLAIARDPGTRLAGLGWRTIEPVSPYHGLRTQPGFYGGEPFFAEGPSGAIDLIAGQAIEIRRAVDCVAECSDVAVAEIVAEDEDDVRLLGGRCRNGGKEPQMNTGEHR